MNDNDAENKSGKSVEEVFNNYQLIRSQPDLAEPPTVDPASKAIQEVLSTQIACLREQLAIRNSQIENLIGIYAQQKRRLKTAAREAEIRFPQLPENPSLLLDLNNSFRHAIVKAIVSLDSVNPAYFPISHELTGRFRAHVLDNMDDEYGLPEYLTDNYGTSVMSWKHYGGNPPAHLPSRLNMRDSSPLLYGDLELEYIADMFSKPGCIRTDNPIPSLCRVFYFEVTILCKGDEGYNSPEYFSP
jgi:hypothetical protein